MILRWVEHGSPDYLQLVELRQAVLRTPLGLVLTEAELAAEDADYHLGAFDGNDCVGCLVLTPLSKSVVKMRQVAVQPFAQGAGLGRRLVLESEKFAVQEGFQRIELNARKQVVTFYRKLGYREVGDEFIEVTIPHMRMWKPLD